LTVLNNNNLQSRGTWSLDNGLQRSECVGCQDYFAHMKEISRSRRNEWKLR